jgi:hypothetical protein
MGKRRMGKRRMGKRRMGAAGEGWGGGMQAGQTNPAGIFAMTSPGCVMTPVTALAAATAGLDR